MPDEIKPADKFCPMFPPFPSQGKLGGINLTFVPCLKDKCVMWRDGDCKFVGPQKTKE